MDVMSTASGSAVKEVSQDVQDMMIPAWEALTPGPAVNWMRYPRDPNRFYVSPSAVPGAVLSISYAKAPAVLISSTQSFCRMRTCPPSSTVPCG